MREHSAPTAASVGREIVLLAQALSRVDGYEFRAPSRPEPSGPRQRGEVSDTTSSTALDGRRMKLRRAITHAYVAVRAARLNIEKAAAEFEAGDR